MGSSRKRSKKSRHDSSDDDLSLVKKVVRERVFLDFQHKKINLGRVVIELFNDIVPITTKNFRALCTGECGLAQNTNIPLCYRNSIIHRIIPGFVIQGGDFTLGNGRGGESIYPGGQFDDEKISLLKHEKAMYVSMANRGPNTNGSQFFLTLAATPHLDAKHQIFGRVIKGEDVVYGFQTLELSGEKPVDDLVIVNCGQMIRKKDQKKKQQSSDSDSDSDHKRKKKSKKKKSKKSSKKKQKKKEKESESETDTDDDTPYCSVDPSELPPEPKQFWLDREESHRRQRQYQHERDEEYDSFRKSKGLPTRQRERSPTPPQGLTNAELRALEQERDKRMHETTGRTVAKTNYKSEGSFRFNFEDEVPMRQAKKFRNAREIREAEKKKERLEDDKKNRGDNELEGDGDDHGFGQMIDPDDDLF